VSLSDTVQEVRLVEREGALGRLRDAVLKVDRENPAPQDLADLRNVLRADPLLARVLFDVVEVNTDRAIKQLAGSSSPLVSTAIGVTVDAMRDGLGYRGAPEIERGLIEVVILCWLRMQRVEQSYTGLMNQTEVVIAQADWWERRMTAAQGRYRRAVESLARVRRLTHPSVLQINVGERQVNVAGVVVVESESTPRTKVEDDGV